MLYIFAVHFTVRQLYIANMTDCFSFKSGRAMQVAKLINEDCPIVCNKNFSSDNFIVLSLKY